MRYGGNVSHRHDNNRPHDRREPCPREARAVRVVAHRRGERAPLRRRGRNTARHSAGHHRPRARRSFSLPSSTSLATLGLFALYLLLLVMCRGGGSVHVVPGPRDRPSPSCSTCCSSSFPRASRSICSPTSPMATSRRAFSGNPYVTRARSSRTLPRVGASSATGGGRSIRSSPYGPLWTQLETMHRARVQRRAEPIVCLQACRGGIEPRLGLCSSG